MIGEGEELLGKESPQSNFKFIFFTPLLVKKFPINYPCDKSELIIPKKGNMAPPKGNQYAKGNQSAKKLKTPELKRDAYEQYCAWIATGKSKESWKFKHPEMSLTSKTMEKYIRESEYDFPPIHKEMAEAESLEIWEARGLSMMLGQIEKSQPAIFQMFMRNKFGWDKENYGNKDTNEPLIKRIAKKWRGDHD